jgi:hypothetical protein
MENIFRFGCDLTRGKNQIIAVSMATLSVRNIQTPSSLSLGLKLNAKAINAKIPHVYGLSRTDSIQCLDSEFSMPKIVHFGLTGSSLLAGQPI